MSTGGSAGEGAGAVKAVVNGTAPPWVLVSKPSLSICRRSRRIVSFETSKAMARESTLTLRSSWSNSRILLLRSI